MRRSPISLPAPRAAGLILALALVIACAAAACATTARAAETIYTTSTATTGDGPSGIGIADLDGDGDTDLATSNVNANSVTAITNNGGGLYTPFAFGPTGASPRALAVGDLNGDSRPDLVTVNASAFQGTATFPGTMTVLLKNAGSGYTVSTVGRPFGRNPFSVKIADLDGDGDRDLVFANSQAAAGSEVSVFLGNGAGTFTLLGNFPGAAGTRSVAVGDLNADTRPDIVSASFTGSSVSVLLKDAVGTGYTSLGAFTTGAGRPPRPSATSTPTASRTSRWPTQGTTRSRCCGRTLRAAASWRSS